MTDYERFGEYESSAPSWGLAVTLLLVGMGAGALAALLLAPASGRQTRRKLRRKYEDAIDTLGEHAEEWRERGSEWLDKAKDVAAGVGERAEEVGDKVRSFGKQAKRRSES